MSPEHRLALADLRTAFLAHARRARDPLDRALLAELAVVDESCSPRE